MFTGIVEEVGTVQSMRRASNACTITVKADVVLKGTKIGDSIATNGVCLTVTDLTTTTFSADVMPETLDKSSLAEAKPGALVNLERAMAADGRFGGHIVSGHIDGTGTIRSISKDGNAFWYTITAPKPIIRLVVEKGSIAIDGISLTVAKVESDSFAVSIIPHTRANTSLSAKKEGSVVNLENDIVGKYVERLMCEGGATYEAPGDTRARSAGTAGLTESKRQGNSGGITKEFLERNGF